jgi:DNA-binding response OmpR family regulator
MPSIFILDDTADILYYLDLWLTEHGYKVYTFNNSKDLMEAMKLITPDIMLLDVRLAELKDGRVLCIELRHNYNYHHPVYLISGSSIISSDLSTCGADGFIKKPFDLQAVLDTINNALLDQS